MTDINDLHAAIDQLIDRKRVRLFRDGGKSEMHTLPSLFEQLEAATGYQGSASGSKSGGSPIPINTEVVALLIDMAETVSEAVMEHAGETRRSVPGNLRLLATKIEGIPDDGEDLLPWWVSKVRDWKHTAEMALRLNPQRPRWARGVTCPMCQADSVGANQDGERVRRPALSIQWSGPDGQDYHADDEWKVRAITCDACSTSWWRGPDLDALVEAVFKANATRETMTG